MDNEMILTFMMSQAQAESESLSGNVKWGHRRNFKDGKVYYHYARSRSIFRNSLRFFMDVPVMPSSAYRRTIVHSGIAAIFSV